MNLTFEDSLLGARLEHQGGKAGMQRCSTHWRAHSGTPHLIASTCPTPIPCCRPLDSFSLPGSPTTGLQPLNLGRQPSFLGAWIQTLNQVENGSESPGPRLTAWFGILPGGNPAVLIGTSTNLFKSRGVLGHIPTS